MQPLSRVLLLAFCLFVSGCGSDSDHDTAYSARQVQQALHEQGLRAEMTLGAFGGQAETVRNLLELFSGTGFAGEGVRDIVYESQAGATNGPNFQVWILDSERRADRWHNFRLTAWAPWHSRDYGLARVQKKNVVAEVWPDRERQVKAALRALG